MSKAKAEPAKTSQEFSTFMQTMAQEGGLRGPNDTISFTDPKSTNRYEIILNDLMHLNRVSPQEMVVAESPKEALAQELGTIFPEEKTGARPKPKPLQNAKTMTPRFDNFAGNGHVIQAVQEREIGFVEALPEKPAPMSDMESAPKPVEPKPMASTLLFRVLVVLVVLVVLPVANRSDFSENSVKVRWILRTM